MKKSLYTLAVILVFYSSVIHAQMVELTFTGKSDIDYVKLDSVVIENITQGGDTILYYPDTVVMLGTVGIDEDLKHNGFDIQNYPNPFNNQTNIDIYLPESSYLEISIYNSIGKQVSNFNNNFKSGLHSFSFSAGDASLYFLTAKYKSGSRTIKMTSLGTGQKCYLDYYGASSDKNAFNPLKSSKGFVYNFGDQLKFIGYAEGGKDTIIDSPTFDVTYEFDFTMGISCPGLPFFTYGGQTYTTVKIGTQCWMAEDLNIGTMIIGGTLPSDDGIIEKYCYDDDTNNCQVYGGLYLWDEMMDYDTIEGIQGICPPGWHIPTDNELCVMENVVDAGAIQCDIFGSRGIDVGGNLKEVGTAHWDTPNTGATNASGFTALAGGFYQDNGTFGQLGVSTGIMSSTLRVSNNLQYHTRGLGSTNAQIFSGFGWRDCGSYLRCIRDCSPQPTQADAGQDTIVTGGITSYTLMGNTPLSGDGVWSIIKGTGGSFADTTNPTTVFSGILGNTYFLRWTISTACDQSYNEVMVIFHMVGPQPCPGIPSFTYGGQTYTTILIGNQCWMEQNLNIGTYLHDIYDPSDNGIIEKYCYWNDTSFCSIYGGIYEWDEMMGYDTIESIKGICPLGWHLPSDNEWKVLEGTVDTQYPVGDPIWDQTGWRGFNAGGHLKQKGETLWYHPNTGATNLYNFTALPGGLSMGNPPYGFLWYALKAYFWTSTQSSSNNAMYRHLLNTSEQSERDDFVKFYGYSVRCLKDTCSLLPTQAYAGSDTVVLTTDTVVLNANTPIVGQGTWSILSGGGGSFSDFTNPSSVFYGQTDSSYVLRWKITTICTSTFDDVFVSFSPTAPQPCPGLPSFTYGGQTYTTQLIGNQCWMEQNLNIGTSINSSQNQIDNGIIEKYCYDEDTNHCITYGGLYQWDEMMDYVNDTSAPGICPPGWHIPSDGEWKELEGIMDSQFTSGNPEWDLTGSRGFDAGGNLKEAGVTHWYVPNTGATNSMQFTALPGGYWVSGTGFTYLGYNGTFWTSTQSSFGAAWYRTLTNDNQQSWRHAYNKPAGYSVRCLKD